MAEPSPFSTPKRKRSDVINEDAPSPLHTTFSFEVSFRNADGGSPRAKVADRFRGLALAEAGAEAEGGGGVWAHDRRAAEDPESSGMEIDHDDDETVMRKRAKRSPVPAPGHSGPREDFERRPRAPRSEIPETPQAPRIQPLLAPAEPEPQLQPPRLDLLPHEQPSSSPNTTLTKISSSQAQKPQPEINRPPEPKPRNRKRAGTPPLVATTTRAGGDQAGDPDAEIVDPIRAALTWHEDEITIYDPEDEDDDGTGINGIGFKPTPAIAYARALRRRQQLAEYKKREESDARARRSERRRGGVSVTRPERKASVRKVHFMEPEPGRLVTIRHI